MKKRFVFSQLGIVSGLILAGVSTLTGGVGAYWLFHDLERENLAYIQQSIGDTTQVLSVHFKSLFEPLIAQVLVVGATQVHPKMHSSAGNNKLEKGISVDTIETDSRIADLSVWRIAESGGAPDLTLPPIRTFIALNSRYPDFNPGYTQLLQRVESSEKDLVVEAFHGKVTISRSDLKVGTNNFGILVAPIREIAPNEVVLVHFRLDYFQNVFDSNSLVSGILVDDRGNVLASPQRSTSIPEKWTQNPLFRSMRSSSQNTGQIRYFDEDGKAFYGGFSRIGVGQLGVLTLLSEAESSATLLLLRKQIPIFLGFIFATFFLIGYPLGRRIILVLERRFKASGGDPYALSGKAEQGLELRYQSIKSGSITVLFGTLRQTNQILEKSAPADSVELINDYFTIASSAVREWGGVFDRFSEKSFVGIWGAPSADGSELVRALRCALLLRKEFYNLNESRKIDGKIPISVGMGVHSGQGLVARFGPLKYQRYSVIGEVLNCAKSLSRLTVSMRVDLLVANDTWSNATKSFEGELLGEVKLTHETGLSGVMSVSGYRNDEGQLIEVKIPYEPVQFAANEVRDGIETEEFIPEKKTLKWLVNNGSQIVGPLTEKEIALRLFAQELDFDCECWVDGVGQSETIRNSGIFSGSGDASATLWMFDGQTIHGPITAGFIKTAVGHGAIRNQVYICEGSTIQGWKTLADWDQNGSLAQTHSEPNRLAPQDDQKKRIA